MQHAITASYHIPNLLCLTTFSRQTWISQFSNQFSSKLSKHKTDKFIYRPDALPASANQMC